MPNQFLQTNLSGVRLCPKLNALTFVETHVSAQSRRLAWRRGSARYTGVTVLRIGKTNQPFRLSFSVEINYNSRIRTTTEIRDIRRQCDVVDATTRVQKMFTLSFSARAKLAPLSALHDNSRRAPATDRPTITGTKYRTAFCTVHTANWHILSQSRCDRS